VRVPWNRLVLALALLFLVSGSAHAQYPLRRLDHRHRPPARPSAPSPRRLTATCGSPPSSGLVRFDGVHFTIFNTGNTKGIINDRFLGLYGAKEGTLYATTTENGGLTVYRQGVFTSYTRRRCRAAPFSGWSRMPPARCGSWSRTTTASPGPGITRATALPGNPAAVPHFPVTRMRMVFASIVLVACASVALAQSGRAGPPGSFVELAYPKEALEKRVQGTVILAVKTDASGKVIDAEPLAGPALLATPAAANAKLWTLTSGARSDVLVFRFEIEHALCADDTRSLFRLRRHNLALVTACSGRGRRGSSDPIGDEDVLPMSLGAAPAYPQSRSVPVGTAPSSWIWPSTPKATSSRRRR
jgi:hypothetical protein